MIVKIEGNRCIVTREKGDKKFYNGTGWDPNRSGDKGESVLLHYVKLALIKQGYDLIKKRMAKDGHMVDDHQQYLRTRKSTGNPMKDIFILNDTWAIAGAEKSYNEDGEVILKVMYNVFKVLVV